MPISLYQCAVRTYSGWGRGRGSWRWWWWWWWWAALTSEPGGKIARVGCAPLGAQDRGEWRGGGEGLVSSF